MGIKIEFYSWESNIGFKYENQNLKSNMNWSWNRDQNPGHRSGTKTLDHDWDQYWD